MNYKIKMLLATIVFVSISSSQTDVSGTISTNTNWDINGSPYTITSNTVIMDGVTLTIEPGVTVLFSQDVYLKALSGGTLIAQGTETDSIYFTVTDTSTVNNTEGIDFAVGAVGSIVQNDTTYVSGSVFDYCVFQHFITTGDGGAISIENISLLIKNSLFENNIASNGGALSIASVSTHYFVNCNFVNNIVSGSGGAIKVSGSGGWSTNGTYKYINSKFINNSSSSGGAICGDVGGYYSNSGEHFVYDCMFINNTSGTGSIFYSQSIGGGVFYAENSQFTNNYSSGDGGIIRKKWGHGMEFDNCIFKNNGTGGKGGITYSEYGNCCSSPSVSFESCSFISNYSSSGGTISFGEVNTSITLSNSFLYNNYTQNSSDGGLINTGGSITFQSNYVLSNRSSLENISLMFGSFQGENNSFIDNESNIVKFQSGGTETVNIENNYWGTKAESEINDLIYDFYDDPSFNTPIADFTPFLMGSSPTVAGSPSSITDLTIKIDSLYQSAYIDSISAGDTIFVDVNGVDSDTLSKGLASVLVINLTSMDTVTKTLVESSETSGIFRGAVYTGENTDNINDIIQGNDGEILKIVSVNNPSIYTYVFIGDARFIVTLNVPEDYTSIQSALNAAGTGDTVLVQPGTYHEYIFWPQTGGIKLFSDGDSSNTIISGSNNYGVIHIEPNNETIIDSTTIISGFKITGGGSVSAIYIANASPKLTYLSVDNNQSGIELGSSNAIIRNFSVSNNSGSGIDINSGYVILSNGKIKSNEGAIYITGSAKLSDMIITQNNRGFGGGIKMYQSGVVELKDCIIDDNHASEGGGIWAVHSDTLKISNTIISNNSASYKGGGILLENSKALLDDLKVLNNAAGSNGGGGILINGNSEIVSSNNLIISENFSSTGSGLYFSSFSGSLFNATIINNSGGSAVSGGGSLFNSNVINNLGGAWLSTTGSSENCNFINNNIGVIDGTAPGYVNFENNYWGHSSGPYHSSQNPLGQGDSVSFFVNVDPWLTSPNIDAPPIPAQNTTITSTGNDFINLAWDTSELGDLDGYKLYFDTDSSGYPYENSVDVGNVTSYLLSNLSLGTTYYLAVTTYDTDGNESWFSNEVSGVTRVLEVQNLNIGVNEDRMHIIDHTPMISFDYYDSMGEEQTSYQIQVSVDSSSTTPGDIWESGIVNSDTTNVQYAGIELMDGNMYYLRVRAASGDFWSDWNYLSFRMNSKPTIPILVSPINNQVTTTPTILSVLNSMDAEEDNILYSFFVYEDASMETRLDSVIGIPPGQDTTSWQVVASLPDNGQYYWYASSFDGYETSSSQTSPFLLNVVNDIPAEFSLVNLSDSADVTTQLPLLDWEVAFDPDPLDTVRYKLYLDTPEPGVVIVHTDTSTNFQIQEPLQDNTTYYWKVVATDLSGATTENTGGYHSFRVNTENDLPSDFALLTPENTSMVTDLTPTLRWDIPTDADDRNRSIVSYHVYLDTNLTSVIPDTVTTNSYTPEVNLLEDAMYSWKVIAVDNDGGIKESSTWSFTTNSENSPPAEFSLVEPLDNAVLNIFNPPFCWEETTDLDFGDTISYTIALGKQLDSMSVIYVGPFMASCFYETMGMVEDNTMYYWNVVASDDAGAVSVSNIQTFTINTQNDSPGLATLIAPLQGSIQTDIRPTFYWSEAHDPDPFDHVSYSIEWWPVNETDVMFIEDVDTNTFTPEYDLSDNSKFGWRVTSKDIEGLSSMTDSSYFFTDAFPEPPLAFNTVYPENNAEGLGTSIDFVWNKTIDPDPLDEVTYQLVYGTDWQDSSTYVYSDITTDTSTSVLLDDNIQYYWIVVARDADGFIVGSNNDTPNMVTVGTLSVDNNTVPTVFALHQNYPNPFNPTTKISYDLPKQSLVTLSIYDLMGRKVRTLVNSEQTIGFKNIQWNATNDNGQPVPAGMYIYTIQAGEFRQTRKMVLLK